MNNAFSVWAPDGIPEVQPGDNLGELIALAVGRYPAQHCGSTGGACGDGVSTGGGVADGVLADRASAASTVNNPTNLAPGDIVVVTSKIVSKAEGRMVRAADREQAITDETVRVVASRARPGGPPLRIVENRLGLVLAAAGVDASNTPDGTVLLLPRDPDASARAIRAALAQRFGVRLGVVITDTIGRPWREGLVDIGIGCAGIAPVDDFRGTHDTHGRPLVVTVTAIIDEVASASELVRSKTAGRPVAVVRGLGHFVTDDDGPGARVMVRSAADDLFREGSAEAYARGYADGLAHGRADGTADGFAHGGGQRLGPVP